MGNNEVRDREKMRREIVGKFFFDLAKTIFAVLVLGNVAPILGLSKFSILNAYALILGCMLTCVLAMIGDRILKNDLK